MTYIDKQGLIDRGWERKLIQLTDRLNKPATTIDDTTVARYIADAESMIDGYLGKRYNLPLGDVPKSLTKVAADLAMYFLHGDTADKDSPVAQAYRDALKWLDQVAKGLVVIESAGVVPEAAGGGQVKTSEPNRVFTRDKLGDF